MSTHNICFYGELEKIIPKIIIKYSSLTTPVMISFQYGVNLGDMQFLYIDLVITTTVAVLSKYHTSRGIVKEVHQNSAMKMTKNQDHAPMLRADFVVTNGFFLITI